MNVNLSAVPKEFQIQPYKCDQYLVNGQLKTWKGNTTNVYSTIQSSNDVGEMVPTLLGSFKEVKVFGLQ